MSNFDCSLLKYDHYFQYARENDNELKQLIQFLNNIYNNYIFSKKHSGKKKILFTEMPKEIIENVLIYCDFKDLCRLNSVSLIFKYHSCDERYWDRLLMSDLMFEKSSLRHAISSKEYYKYYWTTKVKVLNKLFTGIIDEKIFYIPFQYHHLIHNFY